MRLSDFAELAEKTKEKGRCVADTAAPYATAEHGREDLLGNLRGLQRASVAATALCRKSHF
jgi:hypothetical protein